MESHSTTTNEVGNPLLDAEALRVVKLMPRWTPGMNEGKAVKVLYTVPFTFRLK